MSDFLGLAAVFTSEIGQSEFIVIGLHHMSGQYESEAIQKAIEKLINYYDFEKEKIKGKIIDDKNSYLSQYI